MAAAASQRVLLISSAYGSVLLWSWLWASMLSALQSCSLALLLNSCASAALHSGMMVVGVGVSGRVLLLF